MISLQRRLQTVSLAGQTERYKKMQYQTGECVSPEYGTAFFECALRLTMLMDESSLLI